MAKGKRPENGKDADGLEQQFNPRFTPSVVADGRPQSLNRRHVAANRVDLTIAALAAIACLAIIHGAIFAGVLARGLVGRQRARANHRRNNGKDNFREPLHISFNLPQR